VPRARAAHGESAQHDPFGIDLVLLLNRANRFEDVRLTCPAVRHVAAAIYIELDVRLPGRRGRRGLVLLDERNLVQIPVGAVHRNIQPDRLPRIRIGNDEAVRLHTAIDSGHVGADQAALVPGP
jgi:hypothetical protein